MLLSYFTTGHAVSCPALRGNCTCESNGYLLSGALALVACFIEASVGYIALLALFSDAAHGLADTLADVWGSKVARDAKNDPERAAVIRAKGGKVLAVLLLIACAFVVYEWYRRVKIEYEVSPALAAAAGFITAGIERIRLMMLERAQSRVPTSTRLDVIDHAKTDYIHTIIAVAIALIGAGALWIGIENRYVRYADLAFSAGLVAYMLFVARRMWRGRHHHGHSHGHK